MIEALQIAQSGLKATQEWLDVIANNIANTQTTGYKKSSVSFSNMVKPTLDGESAIQGGNSESFGIGTQITANTTNFTGGAIQPTGQALDVAINGSGFLEVVLEDGNYGYTRSGQLKINSEGELTSSAGYRLSDNIVLSPDMQNLTINSDGSVEVVIDGNERIDIGQIKLAMFSNSDALISIGDGIYTLDNNDVAALEDAGENGSGTFVQGFIEGSNVELVEEMTSLVLAQRAYQLNARLVQVMDSIMETTNNIRR